MLGILYMLISCFLGYSLIKKFLPGLFDISETTSLFGKRIRLPGWMIYIPASYLIGTLIVTWVTYILAYAFKGTTQPLFYGNLISLIVFSVLSVCIITYNKKEYILHLRRMKGISAAQCKAYLKDHKLEVIFVLIILAVSSFLMLYTFNIRNGIMYIAMSVYGDMISHISMARSFSLGANFPTDYPHFPDGHIRYHFMFQFLAGNLEYLGLRLDWALNLPSILSMVSFLMLLYSFAVIVTGERWVGILTYILFLFRSSFAFFNYIADTQSIGQAATKILNAKDWIGGTFRENWGLWTQNVYINQRHFAFSLGILLLILIATFPIFKKMILSLNAIKERPEKCSPLECYKFWWKEFFASWDSWIPDNILRSVMIGVILGLISFWNGAVVFGVLALLLFMAVFSKHRLEYVNIAMIAVIISYIQTLFFIGEGQAAVSPKLTIGFLAAIPDKLSGAMPAFLEVLYYIAKYYVELFGILTFVIIAGLFIIPKGARWLTLVFCTPLVLATTVQLTNDVTVNHKYVNISIFLLNMIAAFVLYRMFSSKGVAIKVLALMLIVSMTITGMVDVITLGHKSNNKIAKKIETRDKMTDWIYKNTSANELFLTCGYEHLHPILLAGRKTFYGMSYFAWSAGYNPRERVAIAKEIYGAEDKKELKELVEKNNISYIVIDEPNRKSKDYKLNEKLIKESYSLVYQDAGKKTAIYRTNPITDRR